MNRSALTVELMPDREANAISATNHYLQRPIYIGRNVSYRVNYEGCDSDGIVMYGYPCFSHKKGLYGKDEPLDGGELVMLYRLWLPDDFPKNSESCAIAKTIKQLKHDWRVVHGLMFPDLIPFVKAIITYADETYGHDGTIYKAANFEYIGQTNGRISSPGTAHGRWNGDNAYGAKLHCFIYWIRRRT